MVFWQIFPEKGINGNSYIDTNMVRAGAVSHPSSWFFCGYNEIQEPRRKNVLIDYERLQGLFGAGSYQQLKFSHKGWIEEYLGDGSKIRQDEWTESIAVGSKTFVENMKALLGFRAMGKDVKESGGEYHSGKGLLPITLFFSLKNAI